MYFENNILIYLSDKPQYPMWLRRIGKCSAGTKQGYLRILDRSKSSDVMEKRVKPKVKVWRF